MSIPSLVVAPDTTTGLNTDLYELTMLDAAIADGTATRHATFELFARRLPVGRRYGVVAGIERARRAVEQFRFDDDDIAWLSTLGVLSAETLRFLSTYRFRGDIDAYRDGELYFPHSPVLTVSGTFADIVLETVLLSILNHDSAVAGAVSRMGTAAAGAGLIEMGGRRTDPGAAVGASTAAYIAGAVATSNLAAGRDFGVPVAGTAAHAWILAHDSELEAFRSQIAAAGVDTTLLVDTYSTPGGIDNAVAAAREVGATGPRRIRIDSGEPLEVTPAAREQLDSLGADGTGIVSSGDHDEYSIDRCVRGGAPIDTFGVGTRAVTGSGAPTAEMVFKLVEIEASDGSMRPVEKRSVNKISHGGHKRAARRNSSSGLVEAIRRDGAFPEGRRLQVPVFRHGESAASITLSDARSHHQFARGELPAVGLDLSAGDPITAAHLEEPS